jgi:hypothetical protein
MAGSPLLISDLGLLISGHERAVVFLGDASSRWEDFPDPNQVPDFIALRGDPSIGSQVLGMGRKGAASLLRRHGTRCSRY